MTVLLPCRGLSALPSPSPSHADDCAAPHHCAPPMQASVPFLCKRLCPSHAGNCAPSMQATAPFPCKRLCPCRVDDCALTMQATLPLPCRRLCPSHASDSAPAV
eukprot:360037-Chlamydomonas_euryale.AAC.1